MRTTTLTLQTLLLDCLLSNDEVNIVYDTFTVEYSSGSTGDAGGDVTTTGTFNVTGDTAVGDDASIGFTFLRD